MQDNAFELLGLSGLNKEGVFPTIYIGNNGHYGSSKVIKSFSPIDLKLISAFKLSNQKMINQTIRTLHENFRLWQEVPAPKRGELIRIFAQLVREHKNALAYIITLESGKIYEEALGEVQEVIDVCDFAVGLSRQLYGLTIASERYRHKMVEQWHPLGLVGIITAFNFPMAVWAWNAMIALVCGNTIMWKPSSQTPLSAVSLHILLQKALESLPHLPQDIACVALMNQKQTATLLEDNRVRLISATGSVQMGKKIAPIVSARLGRLLLELGGNNAMIITPSANLQLSIRAVLFSAVGTAGQRCTTLRRLFIHKSIMDKFTQALLKAYKAIKIGHPLEKDVLMGPLINMDAYEKMQEILKHVKEYKAQVLYGGRRIHKDVPPDGYYVKPAIIKIAHNAAIVKEETFAPILYLIEYEDFDEVLAMHNDVPQGLSSAIFTQNLQESEKFMSSVGSDCGIANVNIGTSGAEIGGAFGGEKETGGGRESGSDAWKNYMRRVTNTINYSDDIPLSQGIQFEL